MRLVEIDWEQIEKYLDNIAEFRDGKIQITSYDKKRFYLVEYAVDDIILPKGVYSDFAGLHLQGTVRVYDQKPELRQRRGAESCWTRPARRRGMLRVAYDALKRRLWSGANGEPSKLAPTDGPHEVIASEYKIGADWGEPKRVLKVTPPVKGVIEDFLQRLIGVSGALWNVPRSFTLAAGQNSDDAAPCQLLLIPRNVLWRIFDASPDFRARRTEHFLHDELPGILAENRLFRNTFYLSDMLNWPQLLGRLQGCAVAADRPTPAGNADALSRAAAELDSPTREWLAGLAPKNLGDFDKAQIVSVLNQCLKSRKSLALAWQAADFGPEAAPLLERSIEQLDANESARLNELLLNAAYPAFGHGEHVKDLADWPPLVSPSRDGQRDVSDAGPLSGDGAKSLDAIFRRWLSNLTQNEVIRLNRVLLEHSCQNSIKSSAKFRPLHLTDFRSLVGALNRTDIEFRTIPKNGVIYEEGQGSTELHLILSGKVRIDRNVPGQEQPMLLNRLDRNGFFGLSSLAADEEGRLAVAKNGTHSANARAITEVQLAILKQPALAQFLELFTSIHAKLVSEKDRMRARDQHIHSGERPPPPAPSLEVSTKLLLASDILRIDMNLCTRCDQCVAACAASHDGIPRFHRGNASLRSGQWEIARACVHCSDAPCQRACPVGAITFLEDGPVELHRDRCIGCENCVLACPFDVIEMWPPHPLEPTAKPKQTVIATKCDLCSDQHADPPCVASCPYDAAERGHPRDLFLEIKSWAVNVYDR